MSRKIIKKVSVDRQVLNEWLTARNIDYKKLAIMTGMSTTQAYNLTKKSCGGAVSLGYLVGLGIPGLFYVATYETNGGRKRITDVCSLDVNQKK